MNFIGKIFVVLLTVMSIVFMFLAATVYMTHRNWEDAANKLKSDLGAERQLSSQLQDQLLREKEDFEAKLEAQEQQVRLLQTQRDLLTGETERLQVEVDQLRETNREATAAVAATEKNNSRVTDENAGLRTEVRENQSARDQAFRLALDATEAVDRLEGEVEGMSVKNDKLTMEVGRMTFVMRENNLDPATPVDDVKPRVDGFVSGVRRRGSVLLVEVTIGADDGLKTGHTVEIYRSGKYLGRVQILKTSPDRAVGQVDKRFQVGRIQEGDRVATRLKLS